MYVRTVASAVVVNVEDIRQNFTETRCAGIVYILKYSKAITEIPTSLQLRLVFI